MTKNPPPAAQSAIPQMPAINPLPQPLATAHSTVTAPIRHHTFPLPKLRIHLQDLGHSAISNFLASIQSNEDIAEQVQNVLNLLYLHDSARPATRSVTCILRDMDGVAYTTGIDIDNDHKEIHINLNYIKDKPRYEILGVLCHELVHCFQYDAKGTCPGGLIEGIADWVRLRAGLPAKHWKRAASGKWDSGYQDTGYFLDYLETRFGPGTVRSINACLGKGKYHCKRLFEECCAGHQVEELWEAYGKELEKESKETGENVKEGEQKEEARNEKKEVKKEKKEVRKEKKEVKKEKKEVKEKK